MSYKIRKATKYDNQIILNFIKELAQYENLADEVTGTIENIDKTLFCVGSRI